MPKRIAITLILLSTIVYGTVFLLSRHYRTSFFDEILIQLNRMAISISDKRAVNQTRYILKTILENGHPPATWPALIARYRKRRPEELFYYYKVWAIKTKLGIDDVRKSYPIFKSSGEGSVTINMRYGNTKPVLQFPFFKEKAGNLVAGLFFPINEAPFSADINHDGVINEEDVAIIKKAKR